MPMEVYEALRGRRSAKAFGSEAPPRAVLERVLEAATWAPNHHLTEPWRFFVLQGEGRVRFGEAIGAEMAAGGATAGALQALRTKVVRAPVLVVVAQRGTPDDPTRDLEDYGATCAAVQNLLLAAHAEGLRAKWSTGEMAASRAAFEHLGLDEGDRIVALVYLGADPAGGDVSPDAPKRRPPAVVWRD